MHQVGINITVCMQMENVLINGTLEFREDYSGRDAIVCRVNQTVWVHSN